MLVSRAQAHTFLLRPEWHKPLMKKPSRGYKGDVVTSLFGKRDTILPDKLLHVRVLCVRGTRAVLFFFFSHFVLFFFLFSWRWSARAGL